MQQTANRLLMLSENLDSSKLKSYFMDGWNLNEILFQAIKDETTFYLRPEIYRHPLIFYFGHTAVFYINLMRKAGLTNYSINKEYEELFARGVDPEKASEMSASQIVWPSVEEVVNYRQKAYDFILNLLDLVKLETPITQESSEWAFLMGLEHERIHFETSSVLIRQLDLDKVTKPSCWQYAKTTSPIESKVTIEFVDIPATTVELGKKNHAIFGWDNEYGHLMYKVAEFQVSKNLITNREYKEFVASGDYLIKDFWSEAGWLWRCQEDRKHPRFWNKKNNNYFYRAMFDEFQLADLWPAEVNFYEAEAFARWLGKGVRLMSEAEYMSILSLHNISDIDLTQIYNINFKYGSPCNVGELSPQHDNYKVNDICGNVWQWLSDDFYPLPGFKPHQYYNDFSLPFFGSSHAMLRGGSWSTTGAGISTSYRLWFRRYFYQHAGFRVCRS